MTKISIHQNPSLIQQINDCCHLIQKDAFVLRSGQTSSEYFDTYQLLNQPVLLKKVVSEMKKLISHLEFDYFGGIEMAGIPFATLLSDLTGTPSRIIRQKPKNYGMRNQVEGGIIKSKKLLLVENVITSGGAVIEAVESLRKEGAIIHDIVCLVDRRPAEIRNKMEEEFELKVHALITKN